MLDEINVLHEWLPLVQQFDVHGERVTATSSQRRWRTECVITAAKLINLTETRVGELRREPETGGDAQLFASINMGSLRVDESGFVYVSRKRAKRRRS